MVASNSQLPPFSAPLSFHPDSGRRGEKEERRLVGYTEPRRQRINEALDAYLPLDGRRPPALYEAMRYAVLSDGKRLRPVLCVTGAEICGATLDDVIPTACALELIHAFSLIHDDLPALDNDDLRRGRPSCHKRFGEALAILTGDALFSRAFELLVAQGRHSGALRAMRVLEIVTGATSTDGMAGGQAEDMLREGKEEADLETLEFIHTRKSGALLCASVVAGGVLAGGAQEVLEGLAVYGWAIGHAFQIVDDILGETSDSKGLGKPVQSDRKRRKLTYPRLVGLQRSKEIAAEKIEEALAALDGLGPEADPLRWIAEYVLARSR